MHAFEVTMTNRREFLASATAAGLAVGSLARATAYAAEGGAPDVIVIGAGLSGLETARLIEESGFRVVVVEGRQRIGGRVFTRSDLPGHPELGANSAGQGYGRLLGAAQRGNVEMVNVLPRAMRNADQSLVLGGQRISREAWRTSPRNPLPADSKHLMPWEFLRQKYPALNPLATYTDWYAGKHRSDDISLHAFLRSKGLSDDVIDLVFDTNPSYGDDAYQVSNLMFAFIDAWSKTQLSDKPVMYAAARGNSRIPEAMRAVLKGEVRLGARVVAIDAGERGAAVTLESGEVLRAKAVVSSMPFSTLRHVHVAPGLEGLQREAVHQLRSQNFSVAIVIPRKPFWRDDGLPVSMWTDGPAGWINAERFGATPEDVTGLMVHGRGRVGLHWDRIGPDAAKRLIVSEIERLRPAAKGQLDVAVLHSWTLDPFSAGDWAIFGPNQVVRLVPEMSKPHHRLFFCGEHTGVGNRGMESAMESAERVAIEVLTALG